MAGSGAAVVSEYVSANTSSYFPTAAMVNLRSSMMQSDGCCDQHAASRHVVSVALAVAANSVQSIFGRLSGKVGLSQRAKPPPGTPSSHLLDALRSPIQTVASAPDRGVFALSRPGRSWHVVVPTCRRVRTCVQRYLESKQRRSAASYSKSTHCSSNEQHHAAHAAFEGSVMYARSYPGCDQSSRHS